mmetsp:Transcript_60708/g.114611  ORF Transcript_60708/g.114611 Transcript_60708/m.114611 type:complete len:245 (-) Transcript_60708:137-871(-)
MPTMRSVSVSFSSFTTSVSSCWSSPFTASRRSFRSFSTSCLCSPTFCRCFVARPTRCFACSRAFAASSQTLIAWLPAAELFSSKTLASSPASASKVSGFASLTLCTTLLIASTALCSCLLFSSSSLLTRGTFRASSFGFVSLSRLRPASCPAPLLSGCCQMPGGGPSSSFGLGGGAGGFGGICLAKPVARTMVVSASPSKGTFQPVVGGVLALCVGWYAQTWSPPTFGPNHQPQKLASDGSSQK